MSKYVEVPKKYKKKILDRLTLKNAKKYKILNFTYYKIDLSCLLCEKYTCSHTVDKEICPFRNSYWDTCGDFTGELKYICLANDYISWDIGDDKQAREEIKKLKSKVIKYFKFI